MGYYLNRKINKQINKHKQNERRTKNMSNVITSFGKCAIQSWISLSINNLKTQLMN